MQFDLKAMREEVDRLRKMGKEFLHMAEAMRLLRNLVGDDDESQQKFTMAAARDFLTRMDTL